MFFGGRIKYASTAIEAELKCCTPHEMTATVFKKTVRVQTIPLIYHVPAAVYFSAGHTELYLPPILDEVRMPISIYAMLEVDTKLHEKVVAKNILALVR